jgi:hypothetical protein
MVRVTTFQHALATDYIRSPSPLDLAASAYKDWLHVNVFLPEAGIVAIVNTSLHGDPLSPSALAVGTCLVHRRHSLPGLAAEVDVRERSSPGVAIGASSIDVVGTARIGLGDGEYLTAVGRAEGAHLELSAMPAAEPIEAELPVPFGSGWIAWRAMPRLELDGWLTFGGTRFSLASAIGYHDHNWGRWYWGDDIGWQWGTFPSAASSATLTIARRTDRQHRTGEPIARLQAGRRCKDFPRGTVSVRYSGLLDRPLRRLPGAMAALRCDRQRPNLPSRVTVRVDDGFDRVEVVFDVDDAVQLITGDPARPGQTFIHELMGRFQMSGWLGGERLEAHGVGVFEHVD